MDGEFVLDRCVVRVEWVLSRVGEDGVVAVVVEDFHRMVDETRPEAEEVLHRQMTSSGLLDQPAEVSS